MMKSYTNRITLDRNVRGVWGLDPFKGCESGLHSNYIPYDCGLKEMFQGYRFTSKNRNGCYGLCYASSIARFRGYDFSKVEKRCFENQSHFNLIARKLKIIPFVRMGVSCDPSSNWEHTLKIVDEIKPYNKNIVIITKHWKELTLKQLDRLSGVCVNTSISALDDKRLIEKRLFWFNKLKNYCKSVLRVNTADFNDKKLMAIQKELLNNEPVIDNVLRFKKGHELVKNSIVNVKEYRFLNTKVLASKHKDNIFFGFCKDCPDQCGINL